MNETQIKQLMVKSARDIFGDVVFSEGNKPSDFLSEVYSHSNTDFDSYWNQLVEQERSSLVGGIWTGGHLPNGHPAPEEAVPGASYWIMIPNGSLIFQYQSSPYAPETPGLVPGLLTTDNVDIALNNHINSVAENAALQILVNNYLHWLSTKLL